MKVKLELQPNSLPGVPSGRDYKNVVYKVNDGFKWWIAVDGYPEWMTLEWERNNLMVYATQTDDCMGHPYTKYSTSVVRCGQLWGFRSKEDYDAVVRGFREHNDNSLLHTDPVNASLIIEESDWQWRTAFFVVGLCVGAFLLPGGGL